MEKKQSPVVIAIPSPPDSFEPILTREQVAQRLQVAPETIYSLTRRRRSGTPMPVLRVGKYLRFRWSEVERWLKESAA